ncbi:hypothetical protein [uncultured Corynebacterium sp.]|uniref:hypothetical protein n=1 Tax=uncultured Corynebacterium sp. TaxID=159447 RepID=UPI002594DE64|nr:hypothetical protein [uncultured Corynebacterium sp.]
MAFGRHTTTRPGTDPEVQGIITDALSSDAAALEREAGPIGRAFIAAVDKAVHLQSGPIRAYVDWVRRQNPDATPAQVQEIMDKHFRNAVSGTGAGAGAAAAVPGIGLITGAAAVAGESVLFLDIAAFYTVASAYLRGVEISDPERRRAIVLVALTGSKGLAVVDTLLGENTKKLPTAASLSRFSGPTLVEANNILTRAALKQVRRKISKAWIGKLLPLGLGALAGVGANRKLAAAIVDNVSPSLGPIPAHFSSELPAKSDGSLKDALSPRTFLDFVNKAFGRDGSEAAEAPQPEEGKKGLFRRKK